MVHHDLKKATSMSTSTIEVLFDTPMLLGECPLWQPGESALYWIDIAAQEVHRFEPRTESHRSWRLPSEPGCIALCTTGELVVAMRTGLAMLDTSNGKLTHLANAPYDSSTTRFNDGRCDAAGRMWVGTLYEPRDNPAGTLYCIERGAIRDVHTPVTVSNGVAFSVDNRTLYHADTTAHRIVAYDFNVATGELGRSRLFKQFPSDRSSSKYGGRPDGAAVDSEDAYWCAMYEGSRLLRLSPSGDILQEVSLPVRCPTMVAFGGEDLRTLYITTARHNRPATEVGDYPLSGHILTLRVDVAGRIEPRYQP